MGLLDLFRRGPRVRHVTPDEAHRIVSDGAQFLDVRNRREYRTGHADGARNVALNTLPNRIQHLDPDLPVVCICQSGTRSARAAHLLSKHGFEAVYSVEGGSVAWRGGRLPWRE